MRFHATPYEVSIKFVHARAPMCRCVCECSASERRKLNQVRKFEQEQLQMMSRPRQLPALPAPLIMFCYYGSVNYVEISKIILVINGAAAETRRRPEGAFNKVIKHRCGVSQAETQQYISDYKSLSWQDTKPLYKSI